MQIERLKAILADGSFHHATYRDLGTLWEGLRVYVRSKTGFRGYEPADMFFAKGSPELNEATALVSKTGISIGSYGNG